MSDQYNELCGRIRETIKPKNPANPIRRAQPPPQFLKLSGRQITQSDIDREVSALRDSKAKEELGV